MVNIIKHRYINLALSGALFVVSVVALLVFGLKTGNDFKGGSLLETRFTENVPVVTEVKASIESLSLGSISVQETNEKGLIVKMPFLSDADHTKVLNKIRTDFEKDNNKVLEVRFETIGPAVSKELKSRSLYALFVVVVGIILYIAYSFRKVSRPVASWKYGLVAVVALFHDVTITAGVFAFLGHFAGIEVDIPFVVALLTILGYSVNDTIVVFDRIRENLIRHSAENFPDTVNVAINQTFARSINTTLTTLLTLAVLYFIGGETIKNFTLALLVGIFLGAYSSIFVASPLLVEWFRFDRRSR
ncbi:MAG: Protein translocase subunit SecF [Candidatus Magasanikbacteria bacterium GW2011_GWC2_37_14]|uniref:Protein-export membrane protein SecF n=1 Tax=Candidatus Magasanikbacteria bacterium GW2011_GWC2_37_14 TaxID=1619046 RepID=A0A0G0GPV6_9BACT|nr:MAG: Protein translocase subunit SecF [Candidatus Magasanikbacteria bacterium GW2011_GWC2_37_14]